MTGQKLGCDMQVGDVLTPWRFLILGFVPLAPDRHCRGRRLAVNCWGEGRVIFDDGRYGVAQPNRRATWENRGHNTKVGPGGAGNTVTRGLTLSREG